jgi:hypothetical protein
VSCRKGARIRSRPSSLKRISQLIPVFARQTQWHSIQMRRFATWMFSGQSSPGTAWQVIAWWEKRRIPFNLLVGAYAAVCLAVFFWAIATSGHLEPAEDAVEPLALLAAPIGINMFYTLGWLVEVPARSFMPGLSPRFGAFLLKLGLGLGLALITVPAAFRGGYRLCQVAG